MVNKKINLCTFVVSILLAYNPVLRATEYKLHGIVDVRASMTDSLEKSYLAAGQGKFGSGDGTHLSIAQAGTEMSIHWDNGLSAHGVINAYLSSETGYENTIGFTEAYLKYRTLPSDAGYRLQVKAGIYYPDISLENNGYAWASRDTLNSSMINTWLAEEVRVLGTDFEVTRLGRINNNNFDVSLSASLFVNNDPAGALLAWHGWTMSSRQTLWTEKREIPWFPARDGDLAGQAGKSDPFLELDNKVGYHLKNEWSFHGKGLFSLGYYDNRAIPFKFENGQYGWHTRFLHFGMKWRLAKNISLVTQLLSGKTLMQAPDKHDVVNNDYSSGFVAFKYKWRDWLGNNKHKSTLRIEHFSVTDKDLTEGDNNSEKGKALTLNHTYRLTKHWFLSSEFNVIDSYRPARAYEGHDTDLIEQQFQLAARYFF